MPRLKLLLRCLVIIYQGEPGAPAATKVCAEAEGDNTLLVGFVHSSKLLGQFSVRDIRARRMEDVKNELSSGKKAVCDELAGAESHCCVGLESSEIRQDSRAGTPQLQSNGPPWHIPCCTLLMAALAGPQASTFCDGANFVLFTTACHGACTVCARSLLLA